MRCWQQWRTHSVNKHVKCVGITGYIKLKMKNMKSSHYLKICGSKAFEKWALAFSIVLCWPYCKGNKFFSSPLGEYLTWKIIGLQFYCELDWMLSAWIEMTQHGAVSTSEPEPLSVYSFNGRVWFCDWSHRHIINSVFFQHRVVVAEQQFGKKAQKSFTDRQEKWWSYKGAH